ncbi:MAG: T9SS type B sorting domain-containing protein [Flavobacterium sp.]
MKLLFQFLFFTLLLFNIVEGKDRLDYKLVNSSAEKIKDTLLNKKLFNVAPILTATGNQIFCPGSPMKIVTEMTFVDPDDTGVDAIYIQISTGYVYGEDVLTLTGSHPTITSIWDNTTAKLTLIGISGQPTYLALKNAIKDVEYSSNSSSPSGVKKFSISIGQANYLPSNGHYYQFIPNIGITWSGSRIAAQTNTYYGLQGYLATLTAADEAQIAGEQSSGAGWIGGSDEQQEGVWKWMTGPEAGTNMVFGFWNNGEPNNFGDEDYAHITAVGVGITGSWNDLSNTGDSSGNYQPKGYIVEYGGMPGDPILQISTSSIITIPTITNTVAASNCEPGILTLQATANFPIIYWYDSPVGGMPIATGTSFTTPFLTGTTTYYVTAAATSCPSVTRTAIIATINTIPVLTIPTTVTTCNGTSALLTATTSTGIINWFTSLTNTIPIATGLTFTTPILNQNTTYYIEGNNNGCLSVSRIPVNVVVIPSPIVIDENKILCEDQTLLLDAGLTNVTYLWSTLQTTKTITITSPGIYTVKVTSLLPQNCFSIKTITVVEHLKPHIQDVVIENATATILTTNPGDYEYSIDGITFQNSNVFMVTEGGYYTAYVREKENCGLDHRPFIILTIPEYFTPNSDGYNDYWTINGLFYYPKAEIKIVDRYGKLITKLTATKYSWDGTLNGKTLPSDDYWYVFKIDENAPETRGHFSMKR